jgi:hypothetical protein
MPSREMSSSGDNEPATDLTPTSGRLRRRPKGADGGKRRDKGRPVGAGHSPEVQAAIDRIDNVMAVLKLEESQRVMGSATAHALSAIARSSAQIKHAAARLATNVAASVVAEAMMRPLAEPAPDSEPQRTYIFVRVWEDFPIELNLRPLHALGDDNVQVQLDRLAGQWIRDNDQPEPESRSRAWAASLENPNPELVSQLTDDEVRHLGITYLAIFSIHRRVPCAPTWTLLHAEPSLYHAKVLLGALMKRTEIPHPVQALLCWRDEILLESRLCLERELEEWDQIHLDARDLSPKYSGISSPLKRLRLEVLKLSELLRNELDNAAAVVLPLGVGKLKPPPDSSRGDSAGQATLKGEDGRLVQVVPAGVDRSTTPGGGHDAGQKRCILIWHEDEGRLSVGDSENGLVGGATRGSAAWAFLVILHESNGGILDVHDLAKRVDLVIQTAYQEAIEDAKERTRGRGTLAGPERYEQTQLVRRPARQPAYSDLKPDQVIDRAESVLRKATPRGKRWRARWLHWDRAAGTVFFEYRT